MPAESWVFPNSTLERVIDGDTFIGNVSREVEVDFGFHMKTKTSSRSQQRFRLNRIACAPRVMPSGMGAQVASQIKLIAAPFTITSVGPYKFGDEWMAEVTLADGTNLNDWLVAQQWAVSWNGRGTQPYPFWPRTVTP